MYRSQEVSDINEDLLIIETIDRHGALMFNLALSEDSGEILFRVGNSVASEPIEIGELMGLLDQQVVRLREWADEVKG